MEPDVRFPLCPRCQQRSFDPAGRYAIGRREAIHMCPVCGTDEAIRDLFGMPYIGSAQWPVDPVFGVAVARAGYHAPAPDAPVGGIEQYQAEGR